MIYYCDDDLDAFKPWSGGAETKRMIQDYDAEHNTNYWRQVCDDADELFTTEDPSTDTNVNDWLWFDVPQDDRYKDIFNPSADDDEEDED